jgi:hypothetical protein
MEKTVLKFEDFLNEELNLNRFDNGVCRFSERWFYYNPEDDIIYGSDEKPVGENLLFSFNPVSCTIVMDGKEKQYDVNNPVCLIQYNLDDELVSIYTENTMEVLNKLGFNGNDFTSMSSRNRIQDIFEDQEDDKYILIYGDQMIASTFDVIEEI